MIRHQIKMLTPFQKMFGGLGVRGGERQKFSSE
jgi:hypothetical protein